MKKEEAMRRLRNGEMLYISHEWIRENRCYESIRFVREVGEQNGHDQHLHKLTLRAILLEVEPVRRFVNGKETPPHSVLAVYPLKGVSVETYYTLKGVQS